jgi:tetratricopeptide (TPR) repeat protein
MENIKKIFPLLFVFFSLFSCNYVEPGLQVFWGNYNSDQGNFQKANLAYLNSLDKGELNMLIHYNLGNTYYRLGESESAIIRWDKVKATEVDIQFRLVFNRGVYFYEKGNYLEAARAFKRAVLLNSSSLDAKVNLELSLNRVNTGYERRSDQNNDVHDDSLFDDTERLLNYLKRRETFAWESSDENPHTGGNDW